MSETSHTPSSNGSERRKVDIDREKFLEELYASIRKTRDSCIKYIEVNFYGSSGQRYDFSSEDLYQEAVISVLNYLNRSDEFFENNTVYSIDKYCYGAICQHAHWCLTKRAVKFNKDRAREHEWSSFVEESDLGSIENTEVQNFIRGSSLEESIIMSSKMRGDSDEVLYSRLGGRRIFERTRSRLRKKFKKEFL